MNENLKQKAAIAAIDYIKSYMIDGVGTGSTVNYFIEALGSIKGRIDSAVSSSQESTEKLKALGISVYDLNSVNEVSIYVDGADEINHHLQMIKGGGGALTGEKIIAAVAKQFICIADESKYVKLLGKFPLPIEVIPMARGYVAREIVKLGGDPVYRDGYATDYGNIILDVHNLEILEPVDFENKLNLISGVVTNGIFAKRPADLLLLGTENGVKKILAG